MERVGMCTNSSSMFGDKAALTCKFKRPLKSAAYSK